MSKAFRDYFKALTAAVNETQRREAFIVLATKEFNDLDLATKLALGAEHKVSFERQGVIRRGSVDAFFGNFIIEFKKDITKREAESLDQLRAYANGAWTEDGHSKRAYVAVLTDGARWRVFTPLSSLPEGVPSADSIDLVEIDQWGPTGDASQDSQDLRQFLNRLFYRDYLQTRPRETSPPTSAYRVTHSARLHRTWRIKPRMSEIIHALRFCERSGVPRSKTHTVTSQHRRNCSSGTPTSLY